MDVVGVGDRPPIPGDYTAGWFNKELGNVSRSAALVPKWVGDFGLPDVSREGQGTDTNRSRKFLKHLDDNFLIQVLRELTRKGALLDCCL